MKRKDSMKVINAPGFALMIPKDRTNAVRLLLHPSLANREYTVSRVEAARFYWKMMNEYRRVSAERNAELMKAVSGARG